jgi:hypothetical protein
MRTPENFLVSRRVERIAQNYLQSAFENQEAAAIRLA